MMYLSAFGRDGSPIRIPHLVAPVGADDPKFKAKFPIRNRREDVEVVWEMLSKVNPPPRNGFFPKTPPSLAELGNQIRVFQKREFVRDPREVPQGWIVPNGETMRRLADEVAKKERTAKRIVVFTDHAYDPPKQHGQGMAAERIIDYQAAYVDTTQIVNSHNIVRDAKLLLRETLDQKSKTRAKDIENHPQPHSGIYKDLQFVVAGGAFRVLREWSVNGVPVEVLDMLNHKAYRYELVTFDTSVNPAIETEYTNAPLF